MIKLKRTLVMLTLTVGSLMANNPFDTLETTPPNIQPPIQRVNTYTPEILIYVDELFLKRDPFLAKHKVMLQNLYEQRQGKALWLRGGKINGGKIKRLLKYIAQDLTLDYRSHIIQNSKKIEQDLSRRHTQEGLIQLELQLSTLYYEFLYHTIYGEIAWKDFQAKLKELEQQGIHASWVQYPLSFDMISLLSQENISQSINQVTPKGYRYRQLREALTKLYRIKWHGGWGVLPPFKVLKRGSHSPIVKQLRRRLSLSGDYRGCAKSNPNSTLFDACLQKAVKRFQRRHQVKADGMVGKGTRKLLNISVDKKIQQVKLNLDRIKWLPREHASRYIVVNIPEYMLHYIEDNQEVKNLKVIVGDPKHPTPIFSNKISYIVLNPYWKVPEGIVKKEVVPEMIKNPNYLKRQGLEAHRTWEENSSVMPLDDIIWSDYLDKNKKFPYRLMQPPGPRNALGKIKFKFPNKFSVYLHDTPTKYLFGRTKRAFSHGCVRLSKPLTLLQSIAQYNPHISNSEVKRTLASKKKKQFYVDQKIPIHIIYLTTWINANNELMFGDDVYHYDRYQKRIVR